MSGFGVHIKVKNFKKSHDFYKALGFKKTFEYGPTLVVKEQYRGAVFAWRDATIEIADGHRAVKPEIFQETILSSKVSLMIHIESISQFLKRCKKNDIELAVGPRHFYWGTIEVVVKDPDGLVLVFIAPYSGLEAKRVNAEDTYSVNTN